MISWSSCKKREQAYVMRPACSVCVQFSSVTGLEDSIEDFRVCLTIGKCWWTYCTGSSFGFSMNITDSRMWSWKVCFVSGVPWFFNWVLFSPVSSSSSYWEMTWVWSPELPICAVDGSSTILTFACSVDYSCWLGSSTSICSSTGALV